MKFKEGQEVIHIYQDASFYWRFLKVKILTVTKSKMYQTDFAWNPWINHTVLFETLDDAKQFVREYYKNKILKMNEEILKLDSIKI